MGLGSTPLLPLILADGHRLHPLPGQPAWFGNPSLGTVLEAVWPGRAALSLSSGAFLGISKDFTVFGQSEGDRNCMKFKSKIITTQT